MGANLLEMKALGVVHFNLLKEVRLTMDIIFKYTLLCEMSILGMNAIVPVIPVKKIVEG